MLGLYTTSPRCELTNRNRFGRERQCSQHLDDAVAMCDSRDMNKTLTIGVAVVVAVLCLVLAGVYWTHPADQLPHWLPGYSATDTGKHLKHGLAAVILAIGAGIFAWFQSGPKPAAPPPSVE